MMLANCARVAAILCALAVFPVPVAAQEGAPAPVVDAPANDTAQPAAESRARKTMRDVLASPDFATEETIMVPRLKSRKQAPEVAATGESAWMRWIEKFVEWTADILRYGVWVVVGVVVLALLFTLHYWWRMSERQLTLAAENLPTHVGGLDIRPQSLPDDIGAAARGEWFKGNVVACLSLLYRGALSALVMRFSAAIRSSFTEAECLNAAKSRVDAKALAYLEVLVNAWQLAVYAARFPTEATVLSLCDEFALNFGNPSKAAQDSAALAAVPA
jgi:hypothetical protein